MSPLNFDLVIELTGNHPMIDHNWCETCFNGVGQCSSHTIECEPRGHITVELSNELRKQTSGSFRDEACTVSKV